MKVHVDCDANEGNASSDQGRNKYQPLKPTLVFMAGFAGAGKTTLANYLNQQLGWQVLSKDELKLKYLTAGKDVSAEQWDDFVEKAGWQAFQDLFKQTRQLFAEKNHSLIVDSCGYPSFVLEEMQKIQGSCPVPSQMKILLCVTDKAIRTTRLQNRGSAFFPLIRDLPEIYDDADAEAYFKKIRGLPNVHEVQTHEDFNTYSVQALQHVLA